MTRRSKLEYAQELRGRYFRSSKAAKSRMLDEFTQVTGLHRKAAIRLLHRTDQPRAGQRRGRPKQYGSEVVEVLRLSEKPVTAYVPGVYSLSFLRW